MTASLHPLYPHPPRYETCWLPLLADGGATKARPPAPPPPPTFPLLALFALFSANPLRDFHHATTSLLQGALPPPDVEWVWAVHLLSPSSYIEDCEARYGKLIGRANGVRRRRAIAVPRPWPRPAPARRAYTTSRSPPLTPRPPQAFPLGGQALSAALDPTTTTKAAGSMATWSLRGLVSVASPLAVSVWEQRYPNEPCAAPVSCLCQLPLPAAWAQLSAAHKL